MFLTQKLAAFDFKRPNKNPPGEFLAKWNGPNELMCIARNHQVQNLVKYRGPILCVMSPALGSDDLILDQSATSIQILLQSCDMFLIKLRL